MANFIISLAVKKTGKPSSDLKAQLQKQQRELQASEARFRNIIEKNIDSIIIVDKEGIVRFVNPAAEALFGRKANDFLGESFGFPIVAGEAKELGIIRKGRKPATGEMRVAKIEWEGKNAYLASIRDITDRKRAEQAEAEARAKAELIKQLQRELRSLKHLSGFKVKKKVFPRENLIKKYAGVVKGYVTQEDKSPAQTTEKIAKDFFKEGLSGKDVVDIHLSAMDELTKGLTQDVARKVVEGARFLVLGIMTNLADLYRLGGGKFKSL